MRLLAPRSISAVLLLCVFAGTPAIKAAPIDDANPLVGTASLDDPELLGNAPPPGEEAYSGFTFPGPALPHRDIILGPINKDLTEAAGNHGIPVCALAPNNAGLLRTDAGSDHHAGGG